MSFTEFSANSDLLSGPSYRVHRYTDEIYKIVHFKRPFSLVERTQERDRSAKGNTDKLDAAFSRARRVILEVALCNQWDWFCTFTLDKAKYDRYNLKLWYKDFSQWIRDQRKKTGKTIRYLLIPEMHQDGAWHMHGLFADIPDTVSFAELRFVHGWKVSDKLVSGCFRCWLDYHSKFGFCSLSALKNPVAAAFYMTEYISKSLQESNIGVGGHLYYCSHGLMRSSLHTEIYGETTYFSRWLTQKYEFIETGFTHVQDCLDWTFALQFGKVEPLTQAYAGDLIKVEGFFVPDDGEQLALEDFPLSQNWHCNTKV